MAGVIPFGPASLDRMVAAVNAVHDRLYRSTAALEAAGIPYAVAGGIAVAAWVARIDTSAVRNTPEVNLLIHRVDLAGVMTELEKAGFFYREVNGRHVFLDRPEAKPRDAVFVFFANEKIRADDLESTADVGESEAGADGRYRHLTLEALVRMKLTSFRNEDGMHLRDLLDVGLIDETWPAKFHLELSERLQHVLDNPNG